MIISIIMMIINNNNYYNSNNNNDNILCFFNRFCTQKFDHRFRDSPFPATSLNQLPATFHGDVRFAVPKEMQFEILGAAGWEWSGWSHHWSHCGDIRNPLGCWNVSIYIYINYWYNIISYYIHWANRATRRDPRISEVGMKLEHICHIFKNNCLGNPLSWRPIQVPTSSKKYPQKCHRKPQCSGNPWLQIADCAAVTDRSRNGKP